jgi:predicted nucleic acid-binding protein
MSAGAAAYSDLVKRFRSDWRSFAKIAVTGSLLELAGEVAEQHGLRAGDALHLASALLLRGQIEEEVEFSVSDGQLRTGAVSEGFVVI